MLNSFYVVMFKAEIRYSAFNKNQSTESKRSGVGAEKPPDELSQAVFGTVNGILLIDITGVGCLHFKPLLACYKYLSGFAAV